MASRVVGLVSVVSGGVGVLVSGGRLGEGVMAFMVVGDGVVSKTAVDDGAVTCLVLGTVLALVGSSVALVVKARVLGGAVVERTEGCGVILGRAMVTGSLVMAAGGVLAVSSG